MKDKAQQALDRMEQALDRSGRKRRRGFSTAPFVFAAGLVLGYQLLVRLVPQLWANILPGGFEQGALLNGWPHLVWRLAWFCHLRFPVIFVGCLASVATAIAFGRTPWGRPVVWLMAVGTIVLNAAILVIALKTGMDAQGVGQLLNP